MTAESEAVMVSPEQCATAPRPGTKGATLAAAPKANPTRLVLLAVLALAAATGAMFGVVVFGNEFTKDVHANGGAHMNAVTLVDGQDRAIATADVESYVSLLDLPLLGTAELNKVDGITYSTYRGVEHRKVTGYSIVKETATVGGSVVETPRLSLRSEPGVTIEVSVRDAKAWILESGAVSAVTDIDVAPTRRLGDASGSCLANGACLYSREEILRVDAESRRLTEGGFFARADVAAYQVDLNGEDTMKYASGKGYSLFEGKYKDKGGHDMLLRVRQSASTEVYLKNLTDDAAKLMGVNGTFLFQNDVAVKCLLNNENGLQKLDIASLKSGASGLTFTNAQLVHGRNDIPDFIPYVGLNDCAEFSKTKTNYQQTDLGQKKPGNFGRRMAAKSQKPMSHAEKRVAHEAEMKSYMNDPKNERNQQLHEYRRQLAEDFGGAGYSENIEAMLSHSTMDRTLGRGPNSGGATYITHFDLWISTRLADPTFTSHRDDWFQTLSYVEDVLAYEMPEGGGVEDSEMAMANVLTRTDTKACQTFGVNSAKCKQSQGKYFSVTDALNLMGSDGIGADFMAWSGLTYAKRRYLQPYAVDTLNMITDNSEGKTKTVADTLDASGKITDNYQWWMQDISDVFTGSMYTAAFRKQFSKIADESVSMSFFHAIYPGSCTGGYEMDTWSADLDDTDQNGLTDLIEDAIKAYTPSSMWNDKKIFKRSAEFDWDNVFNFCGALETENQNGAQAWDNAIWTEYDKIANYRNNYGIDSSNMVTTNFKDCASGMEDRYRSGSDCLANFITVVNEVCRQANNYMAQVESNNAAAKFPRFEIGKGSTESAYNNGEGLALKQMNTWASYIEKDPDGPMRLKDGAVAGNSQKPEFIVAFQGTKSTDTSMIHYSLMNDPIYTCLGSSCNIHMDGYFQYMNGLKGCLDDFVDNHMVIQNGDSFNSEALVHAHTTFITGHSLGAAAATIYAQTRPLHRWQPLSDGSSQSSFSGSVDAKLFPRLVVFGSPPTGYKGFKAIHPDNLVQDQGLSNNLGNTIKCVYPTSQGHMKHAPMPSSYSGTQSDDFGYVYGICSGKSDNGNDPYDEENYGMYMTASGFTTYQSTHGGSSGYCGRAMKQSVGFMHKFDPFPSMLLVGHGQYGHSQEFHVMLMDKYVSNCDVTHGLCSMASGTLDTTNYDFTDLANERAAFMQGEYDDINDDFSVEVSNPYLLTQYLCTKIGTEPISWGFKCNNNVAPYMSLLNPAPCAMIELVAKLSDFLAGGQLIHDLLNFEPHSGDISLDKVTNAFFGEAGSVCMWGQYGKVSCYDIYSIDRSIFNSFESTATCIEDWAATSENYIQMSIADMWFMMGALFTATVHSAYGFYPLCITGANSDRINYDGGESPKSYWGASSSTVSGSYENNEASCTSAQYNKIDAHCLRGDYMNWGDCISASDFHTGVAGACVPCCQAEFEATLTDTAAYCGSGGTSSAPYNC